MSTPASDTAMTHGIDSVGHIETRGIDYIPPADDAVDAGAMALLEEVTA